MLMGGQHPPFPQTMYTLEQLQQKTFKELKEIGWQLNVFPAGDRRCRQYWIDALVGAELPLLELLETSPGVEAEPVQEAIEIQRQEPIESKFGRIIYPKPAIYAIAQTSETSPGVSFDVDEFRQTHAAEVESYFKSFTECDRPPNRGDGRGRRESKAKVSESAILFEGCANGSCASPLTFSPRFLATYPPYFGDVHYKADATGQLNLLEPETEDEPPDPDDFESLDAFRKAITLWDSENPEPLAVSMDSMCEWAPCPADWYEPEAEKLPLKASSMREPSQVSELSPAMESSSTCKFLIPVFDVWCDRPNRQNDTDEPPDTGIFARLPKPKPPSFPPMVVVAGDRSSIKKFARSTALLSGRSPPGGDAINSRSLA